MIKQQQEQMLGEYAAFSGKMDGFESGMESSMAVQLAQIDLEGKENALRTASLFSELRQAISGEDQTLIVYVDEGLESHTLPDFVTVVAHPESIRSDDAVTAGGDKVAILSWDALARMFEADDTSAAIRESIDVGDVEILDLEGLVSDRQDHDKILDKLDSLTVSDATSGINDISYMTISIIVALVLFAISIYLNNRRRQS